MKPALFTSLALALFALSGAALATEPGHDAKAAPANAAPHWGYEEAANWGKLDASFRLCEEGQSQSPINIKASIDADLAEIVFAYQPPLSTQPVAQKVLNNGHTIQLNIPAGQGMKAGRDAYQLLQFHFHTPSEYQLDGKSYPLEVHFVHKRGDGALGVVGVMFEEGEANTALEKIWQSMPDKAGEKTMPGETSLDMTKLLPRDQRYYRFMGSLTTPPCSEGVNWHMMQKPVTASKEQIEAFRKIFPMNARPLQQANSRLVVKDTK